MVSLYVGLYVCVLGNRRADGVAGLVTLSPLLLLVGEGQGVLYCIRIDQSADKPLTTAGVC